MKGQCLYFSDRKNADVFIEHVFVGIEGFYPLQGGSTRGYFFVYYFIKYGK
jgi:hypothetical protein